MKAKTAFVDIENAPILGYTWESYETDVLWVVKDWYLLSFSVKWMEGKQETWALPDFPLYKKDKENDKELCKKLWEVMDQADVLIAHNGDNFDFKKANARFITHGLDPPSPYKTIDTLKEARGVAKFTSNRLNDVCDVLGIGRKVPHTGKNLWRECIAGNMEAWKVMKKYNAHDVFLLEKLYLYLRPWVRKHPNLSLFTEAKGACPKCQSKKLEKRGFGRTSAGSKRQRYQCLSCGGWSSGPLIKGDKIEII